MSDFIVEVCANTITDCINANNGGANRIELVSAMYMGGLTPSLGLVKEALKITKIPIVAMVRSRGGGFNYSKEEIEVMFLDAKLMLEAGVDGIVFGFLNSDYTIDIINTKKMVDLIKSYNKEAIIHRAFDLTPDLEETTKILIDLKVDRILTSGGNSNIINSYDVLHLLNSKYGSKIEFLVGSGVNSSNALDIINKTNIKQLHATFKVWNSDITTSNDKLSYRYSELGDYEVSSELLIRDFIKVINKV